MEREKLSKLRTVVSEVASFLGNPVSLILYPVKLSIFIVQYSLFTFIVLHNTCSVIWFSFNEKCRYEY